MKWGLVNRVAEEKALDDVCVGLAQDIASYRTNYTIRDKKDRVGLERLSALDDGLQWKEQTENHSKKHKPEEVAARRHNIQARTLTGRRMILLTLKLLIMGTAPRRSNQGLNP